MGIKKMVICQLLQYLVSVGADPTANNNIAVQWASEKGHLPVIQYLVSVGADVTACNNRTVQCASKK